MIQPKGIHTRHRHGNQASVRNKPFRKHLSVAKTGFLETESLENGTVTIYSTALGNKNPFGEDIVLGKLEKRQKWIFDMHCGIQWKLYGSWPSYHERRGNPKAYVEGEE